MQDDATKASRSDDDEDLDDAILAADDTGMLAGERMITIAEIEEAEGKSSDAGDV